MAATRSSKPGLRDVARRAGVSLATASRALSQPDLVSPAVREKVEEACRELRYIPNRVARQLSQDRSDTIGVIVPSIGNPLFAPTVDGVRSALDEHGFGILINSAERDPAREFAQFNTLLEHGVDAVISMMPVHVPQLFDLLRHTGMPTVFLSTGPQVPPFPTVNYDNQGAVAEIVRHVLALGHRRIAVLSGPRGTTPVIAARVDTVLRLLAEAGCAPGPDWLVECDFSPEAARKGARAILSGPERPSAIICTGDQHAVASIAEAQSMGLRVPEELSVTGCNDVAIAQLSNPQLTTMHLPYFELGVVAGRIVLGMLNGEDAPALTLVPHRFMQRASTAQFGKDDTR